MHAKRDKKLEILACSIKDDQEAVAKQWADTFIHNSKNDCAVNMAQLLLSCVARGDFKVRPFQPGQTSELQAPSSQLKIVDYISHASRIIIDYRDLNEANKKQLLEYFPRPAPNNTIVSRSATHDVQRINGQIVEGKGLFLGLAGQLPAAIKNPQDFGVNIAMGGAEQTNFYNKKIAANGYSGHFYFHRNDVDSLLMLGLEQSAPVASALELVWGAPASPVEVQQHHDQFGQGHSLLGASDVYTAAGSLYFSDPAYQIKLLAEKGVLPPEKYGAMQVKVTNENWAAIQEFFNHLHTTTDERHLSELLLTVPVTAKDVKTECSSYIAFDFDNYLKRIYQSFIGSDKTPLGDMHFQLLHHIKELQRGQKDKFAVVMELIKSIEKAENIPNEYRNAIGKIKGLFTLHLRVDPQLSAIHPEYLLQSQYDELQDKILLLLANLILTKKSLEKKLPQDQEDQEDQEEQQFLIFQIGTHIHELQNSFKTNRHAWLQQGPSSYVIQALEAAKIKTEEFISTDEDEVILPTEEELHQMSNIQLVVLGLEMLAVKSSMLINQLTLNQELWQRIDTFLSNPSNWTQLDEYTKGVAPKIAQLRDIHAFWELSKFRENRGLKSNDVPLAKLQKLLQAYPILGGQETIDAAQRLQEFLLQIESIQANKDYASFEQLEQTYKKLSHNEQIYYKHQFLNALQEVYQTYLASLNNPDRETINDKKNLFVQLEHLFAKMPEDLKKQYEHVQGIKKIENSLYQLFELLENEPSLLNKHRKFTECQEALEKFKSIDVKETSEFAKAIYSKIQCNERSYQESLKKAEGNKIAARSAPVAAGTVSVHIIPMALDSRSEQQLDNVAPELRAQLKTAVSKDVILEEAIKKAKRVTSAAVVRDVLILKQFHDQKIALFDTKGYKESLDWFYEKALDIRLSDDPLKVQADKIIATAENEFKHRHDTRRLIADVIMTLSVVGLLVGVGRKVSGRSFFFSNAKTNRELELRKDWVAHELPDDNTSEAQILTSPAPAA